MSNTQPPTPPVNEKTSTGRFRYRKRVSKKNGTLEWLVIIIVAVVVALLIRGLLFQAYYIPSESMENTLLKGDRVLVNKVSYKMHSVGRDDIVVFKKPKTAAAEQCYADQSIHDLIKRVIGLPGDTIEMVDGTININGKPLKEPYIKPGAGAGPALPRQTVPKDTYFVMGDNRDRSLDSRCAGPIPKADIVGKAQFVMWPPSSMTFF